MPRLTEASHAIRPAPAPRLRPARPSPRGRAARRDLRPRRPLPGRTQSHHGRPIDAADQERPAGGSGRRRGKLHADLRRTPIDRRRTEDRQGDPGLPRHRFQTHHRRQRPDGEHPRRRAEDGRAPLREGEKSTLFPRRPAALERDRRGEARYFHPRPRRRTAAEGRSEAGIEVDGQRRGDRRTHRFGNHRRRRHRRGIRQRRDAERTQTGEARHHRHRARYE